MEKYVAIDNVCAWPNIKQRPNGEVMAIIFDQPCHLLWEGTIACWASSDQGRSWKFRSNPVVNAPGTNRGNVAVGVTSGGDTVVLCSGWDKAQPAPGPFVQGNVNDDRITYRQADNRILTAYYSGPNEYHHRYHMGTVLWDYEQVGRSRNQCREQ